MARRGAGEGSNPCRIVTPRLRTSVSLGSSLLYTVYHLTSAGDEGGNGENNEKGDGPLEELHFADACEEEHFAAMSLIHALGWRTTYPGAVPAGYLEREITDDRWVPCFREDHASGRRHGLLLYRGDTPVSCATYGPARMGADLREGSLVSFHSAGYEGWGEIVSFYTHPEEKGKGYGGLLMEEILRRMKAEGFPSCFVFVLRENQGARRFYARHGFSWDGTQADIPFPPDTVCVDLRYVREL